MSSAAGGGRPRLFLRTSVEADAPSTRALWRAVDTFRVFALGYAVYTLAARTEGVERPGLGWAVLGVLAVWTVSVPFLRRRGDVAMIAELALAVGAILASRLVDAPQTAGSGISTLPGVWPGATVLAWGLHRGVVAGVAAAFVVSVADLVEVGTPTSGTTHNIVLLFAMGICAGYTAAVARRGDAALAEGLRLQARSRERERLARTVHDGVLQTLSLIHRRGDDVGGVAASLGQVAAEQERVLRALISDTEIADADGPARGPVGEPDSEIDVRSLLRLRGGPSVEIVLPADRVPAPRERGIELDLAVAEALTNVERHAGPGARAWVLLEADGSDIVVTVRDDGVGMPPDRLEVAHAEGRMGVARSIRGRLEDLGGVAVYGTTTHGTRLEMRMPAQDPDRGCA